MTKNSSSRLSYLRLIFMVISVIGFLLLIYMVSVESEPGMLPMILVLMGLSGFFHVHFKQKND